MTVLVAQKSSHFKSCFLFTVKKAYYKQSLKVHPDRAAEEDKEDATVKFQTLSRVYTVLSDKARRNLYDETGWHLYYNNDSNIFIVLNTNVSKCLGISRATLLGALAFEEFPSTECPFTTPGLEEW